MSKNRKKRPAQRSGAPKRMPLPPPGPARMVPNEFAVSPSGDFAAWLAETGVSLALTTYHTGRLFCFGLDDSNQLTYSVRAFQRAMGLCVAGDEMWLGTAYQVWRFRNMVPPGRTASGCDRVYAPRTCHVTGTVDIHDIVAEESGRLVFANTLFSCAATLDEDYSFREIWRPWWVTGLVAEDRCHLNGLCVRDGKVRYATAVGMTDTMEGWRKGRAGGGVLVDTAENRVVLDGLSMPHSPRWHDGKVWLIDSGTGWLVEADPESGERREVCFCPGFARGLAITGRYAVVGISDQRVDRSFSDLGLEANLGARGLKPSCAVLVIDLDRGEIVHRLTFSGQISEIYEVALIPGARRCNVIGFMNNEVERIVVLP